MGEPRHWHLVMYDVSDEKALRKVHEKLIAWGRPMQYSVFRVRSTEREMERMKFELLELMSDEDRLAVVRLCDSCAQGVSVRGKELSPFDLDTPPFRIA